jgi:glutamine synthetase type III
MATVGLSTYKPSGNSESKTLGELKDSVKTDLKKQKLLKEKDTVKISDSSKELREELNKLTNENKKLDPAKAVEKIHQSKFGNLQKPALFLLAVLIGLGQVQSKAIMMEFVIWPMPLREDSIMLGMKKKR